VKDRQDVSILAERIRAELQAEHVTEKRMFGGITFLLNGNMLCCASKQGLMVRVGKEAEAAALSQPLARPCLGTGRRMAGFIMVEPTALQKRPLWLGGPNLGRQSAHISAPGFQPMDCRSSSTLSAII
jgi:hypothetical protein